MKILLVQESNWLTRNPHQQHHLMERLVSRDHIVRVIDYDIDWKKGKDRKGLITQRIVFEDVHKILPDAGINVIRPSALNIPILEYPSLLITHSSEIKKQIIEFHPDLIIGFGILNAWAAARLARRHSIPFIYYWIDSLDTLIAEKNLQWIARLIEKKTLARSTRVLAINKRLMDYVISLGALPDKTYLLGAGIDLGRFDPSIDRSEIRKFYGIPDTSVVLFFMGWLYQFSGLKEMALELAKKREEYGDFILLIVGDGDALSDLQGISTKYHLNGQMILSGKQPYDKIPEFLAASDICILPADPHERIMQDIVPIKIYEYMAMKKPVICTKLPGIIREFGEENGIIYADNPDAVLEMAMTLRSSESMAFQGERGRKYVEDLDWKNVTNSFETIITEVSRS